MTDTIMAHNGVEVPASRPQSVEHLKSILVKFSLSSKVDAEGTVTVEDGVGNAQYMAKGPAEIAWLNGHADEVEKRGCLTEYRFNF